MSPNTSMDPCISYGRGGAGNMRRRSSIIDAWAKIASDSSPSSSPPNNSSSPLSTSPDDASKPERRSVSTHRRRASSMWSLSTGVTEKSGMSRSWKTLFLRRRSVGGGGKVEDAESDFGGR
ncbi:hypothetical protein IQ07DRAFT_325518 [Pyrenochaeta sp. DS3sAY3a]|nr:hypothetical protein IQ07DRAFT_325518 [Pyrenochaeta sp. DS3sAY3a]